MKVRMQITVDLDMKFLTDYFTKMPTASLKDLCFCKPYFTVRKLNDNNPKMDKELLKCSF